MDVNGDDTVSVKELHAFMSDVMDETDEREVDKSWRLHLEHSEDLEDWSKLPWKSYYKEEVRNGKMPLGGQQFHDEMMMGHEVHRDDDDDDDDDEDGDDDDEEKKQGQAQQQQHPFHDLTPEQR